MRRVTIVFVFEMMLHVYCDNETVLQSVLMTNYNRNVAPLSGIASVDVDVTLSLFTIVEFNEIKETITISAAFVFKWYDRNLAWNSSDYGNVTETIFRQEQLWLPDVMAANAVNGVENLGNPDLPLLVKSDGLVSWTAISTVEMGCKVNTEYFPYDKQICKVQIINRAQTINMMTLRLPLPYVMIHAFTPNGQWNLMTSHGHSMVLGNVQIVQYDLTLRRRSGYYVTSLIMPILVVSVLNCFVLMLPSSSGEKISFSITVFLSYMVLLTFTTDNLPRTSEFEPYIVNYISTMLGLSFTSVVCTVISLMIQPIIEKMKSRDKDDDDVTDDVNSKFGETPVVCISDKISTSAGNGKLALPSNVIGVKPAANAWTNNTDGQWNSSENDTTSQPESKYTWIPVRPTLKNLKVVLFKFLKHFDFISCSCVIFVTVFITTRTMLILVNNDSE